MILSHSARVMRKAHRRLFAMADSRVNDAGRCGDGLHVTLSLHRRWTNDDEDDDNDADARQRSCWWCWRLQPLEQMERTSRDHFSKCPFFSRGGGWAICPKIFRQLPKKLLRYSNQTACYQRAETVYIVVSFKIALLDSPHPITISKNPGFRALHLAGR